MYCVAVKNDHAADPLSHGTREAPNRGLYLLWVNWQYTYGSISRTSARVFQALGRVARKYCQARSPWPSMVSAMTAHPCVWVKMLPFSFIPGLNSAARITL